MKKTPPARRADFNRADSGFGFANRGAFFVVGALAVVLFARMLGVFIILPVAAPLVGAMDDAPPWAVGLALGGYGLTQALMQIPTGILADRYGRKPVLLVALMLFAAGGFWAAAADSVGGVVGGRLLQGAGAVAAVAAAWIADVTVESRRAQAMALFGVSIAAAFVVSLFVASPLAAAVGLSGIFKLAGALGVLSIVLLLFLPSPPQQRAAAAPSVGALIATPVLRRCAGGGFALHYAMAAMFFLLPAAIADSLPAAEHWQVYAGGFAASLPLSLPLLALLSRRPNFVMPAAVASTGVGAALLIFAASPVAAAVALVFFFAGFVVLEAALPAAAAKAAPPQHRAAAIGIVITAEFIGVFLGGALTGLLIQTWGNAAAGGFVCFLFVAWLASFRKNAPNSVQ